MPSSAKNVSTRGIVYVVDDEEMIRGLLARIIERSGWTPRLCDSGMAFLDRVDDSHPACVLLDLSMPGLDGIDVQRKLNARGIAIPVIFLTGAGTVPVVAEALRGGAFDFIEKPPDKGWLVKRIGAALLEDARRARLASIRRRFESMTTRELQICELLSAGMASKQIAQQLSISARTVEHHRARILQKSAASNTAELASLYGLVLGSEPRS